MNKGIYVVIDTPTLWHDARFIIDIVFMAAAVFHLEKFHYSLKTQQYHTKQFFLIKEPPCIVNG